MIKEENIKRETDRDRDNKVRIKFNVAVHSFKNCCPRLYTPIYILQ